MTLRIGFDPVRLRTQHVKSAYYLNSLA